MIKKIAPHSNTELAEVRRALLVLRPWQATQAHWLFEFRANPRPMGYMLDRAAEFRQTYAPQATFDLVTDPGTASEIAQEYRSWLGQVHTSPAVNELKGYDTVVLLYPDALGLGWAPLERMLPALGARQYLVINGRRRIFVWDRESRRALRWRRRVAGAHGFERLLAPALVGVAAVLAIYDALTGQAGQ